MVGQPLQLSTMDKLHLPNNEKRKGSAEDEPADGVARYAKLRPMRVEMYGMNWN